jgi:hypothetical protein
VKQWLESEASDNWILVLDNADNKLHFFPNSEGCESPGLVRYIPRAPKGVVVVTTRDFEVATQLVGPVGVLMKEAVELNDAEVLFKSHHPSGAPHDSECINLLRELQCLPLAITQVASYLEMNRQIITVSERIGKFRRTRKANVNYCQSQPAIPGGRINSHRSIQRRFWLLSPSRFARFNSNHLLLTLFFGW